VRQTALLATSGLLQDIVCLADDDAAAAIVLLFLLLLPLLLLRLPLYEGALMLRLAKEVEQRCMHVLKMQPAGATTAPQALVGCSAPHHTLAMCVASVLQVTASLSHSAAGHA
jgi:hypothetical protein